MKKIYIIICTSFALFLNVAAQQQTSISQVLSEIETNNTELKALKQRGSAQKIQNKTLNNLENPQVEATHKPKRKTESRNTEIEVTQSFDFPTAYGKRGDLIDNLNLQEDYTYGIRKNEVRTEAYALLINGIYYQEKLSYTIDRNADAEKMYDAYKDLLKLGQIDILEYNKTKLNLLESRKGLELCRIEMQSIQDNLKALNGGIAIDYLPKNYADYTLPLDFENWFTGIRNNNAQLLLADTKLEMGKQQERLVKALNLPKLKVGYVAEIDPGQTKNGFIVGFSIPLWQGRNTLKASKLQTTALLYEKQDEELKFKEALKNSFQRSVKYKGLLEDYQGITYNMESIELLKKSLELGRINLLTYLQELLIYYQSVDSFLEIQRDYNLSLLELRKWELL